MLLLLKLAASTRTIALLAGTLIVEPLTVPRLSRPALSPFATITQLDGKVLCPLRVILFAEDVLFVSTATVPHSFAALAVLF